MPVSDWLILLSLLCVLLGTFLLRSIRIGVLLGLVVFAFSRYWVGAADILPLWSGLVMTFELLLLIVGALVFYNILAAYQHFKFIDTLIDAVPSPITLIVILGMFLGGFFEGIAGFGIPAMLIAPLLVRMGISTFSAIVLSLSANIIAVTFGALGTPFKLALNIYSPNETTYWVLLFNVLPALLLPFLVAFLANKTEKITFSWKKEWKLLLGAGACFAIPYFLMGLYSVEFPSVLGGGLGLILFVLFFVKDERLSFQFWLQAFYPYLLLVVLLLAARYLLADYHITFQEGVRALPIYQPGLFFLLVAGIYVALKGNQKPSSALSSIVSRTVRSIWIPLITILLLVSYTQLVRTELALLVSQGITLLPATLQKLSVPLAGISGSFITGSSTMSNLLMMNIAYKSTVLTTPVALALLHTGSTLGNVISLQNIVMVKSALDAQNSESEIIPYGLITVGIYFGLVLLSALLIYVGMSIL
jgi:lactate permease